MTDLFSDSKKVSEMELMENTTPETLILLYNDEFNISEQTAVFTPSQLTFINGSSWYVGETTLQNNDGNPGDNGIVLSSSYVYKKDENNQWVYLYRIPIITPPYVLSVDQATIPDALGNLLLSYTQIPSIYNEVVRLTNLLNTLKINLLSITGGGMVGLGCDVNYDLNTLGLDLSGLFCGPSFILVGFLSSTYTIPNDQETITIPVRRTGSTAALSVTWTTTTEYSGVLTWGVNDMADKIITLTANDHLDQGRVFEITLSNPISNIQDITLSPDKTTITIEEPNYLYITSQTYPFNSQDIVESYGLSFNVVLTQTPFTNENIYINSSINTLNIIQTYFPVEHQYRSSSTIDYEALAISSTISSLMIGQSYYPIEYIVKTAASSTVDGLYPTANMNTLTLIQTYFPIEYVVRTAASSTVDGLYPTANMNTLTLIQTYFPIEYVVRTAASSTVDGLYPTANMNTLTLLTT